MNNEINKKNDYSYSYNDFSKPNTQDNKTHFYDNRTLALLLQWFGHVRINRGMNNEIQHVSFTVVL